MRISLHSAGNKLRYFNVGGIMQTDWYQVGSKWYYLRTDAVNDSYPVGSAVTGAQYLPTTKGSTTRSRNYYFDYNCSMVEWTYPVSTSYVTLSSCFNDPRSGNGGNHQGIDIPAASGTTIKSCSDGDVYRSGYDTSMGYYSIITSNVKDSNGNSLILRYMHMMQFPSTSTGTSIAEGDIVGYVGSTGDQAKINKTFASEYAAVSESGSIYTVFWLAAHTAEDYKAAGLSESAVETALSNCAELDIPAVNEYVAKAEAMISE